MMSFVRMTTLRESKAASPLSVVSGVTFPSPSFVAIKQAVISLSRVDDFILESIGSGFFSQVYKATHKDTNQVLVLKLNTQPSNRSNVLREIRLLSQLSHPNILRFFGVCVSDGQLHALTELVDGGSLEQIIADKRTELPWSVRIRLGCDIVKGIKYMHCRGIMHRDLTSKNILVRKLADGRLVAVVADLGLATNIPDPRLDRCLPIVGSPYWMAPECIMGYKYNEKADIFSYGIILCELIARVEADPEVLPRTNKFGVDYVAFSRMVTDCPLHFLHLTFVCCQIDPRKRPSSSELVNSLEVMKYNALIAVILADLSRLNISSAENAMNRAILEDILMVDVKRHKRTRSEVQENVGRIKSPLMTPTMASDIQRRRRVVPVTPLTVGQVMSKDDVHYAPHTNTNPFIACFADNAVKVIDGCPMSLVDRDSEQTLTPADAADATSAHLPVRHLIVSRSVSWPSSYDSGAACCSSDEAASNADSTLELDRHVVARTIEDFEMLFDDEISQDLTDDSSSLMSSTFDEATTLLSPQQTAAHHPLSGRTDQFELKSAVWHEHFQRLLCRWQTKQFEVNPSLLSPRLRQAVPYLVQRFAELKRIWEQQQHASVTPTSEHSIE